MIMNPAVLAGLLALTSPMVLATPIDEGIYTHMLDENGESGPCRGVNASDKVDERSKGDMTQEACEKTCTDDGEKCIGYSYSAGSENGLCIIYGDGQDGSCPSHPEMEHRDHCGECSVTGDKLLIKNTCGTCKIPDGQTEYGRFQTYAENEGFCLIQGGTWTAGTWTAGTWTEPADGWEGASYVTTHINYVSSVAGYDCYDKDLTDHLPSCAGTADDTTTCQSRFEMEVEGDETVAALTEEDCTAGGVNCVFTAAPKKPLLYVHSPIETTDGWNEINIPFGDALNPEVPIKLGACRSEGTSIAPPSQKDCRWDLCRASTGESVGTQAGCRQACLDCPSGTCTAYSHKDDGYCVIHGPHAHLHALHYNKNDKEMWVDEWATRERDMKFCLENIPDNPPGCEKGDTAKPNPQYMCQSLKTTSERWAAFGETGSPAELVVHVNLEGDRALLTDDAKAALKKRMAALVFWNESETKLMVEDKGEGPDLHFMLDIDTTISDTMVNMLLSQFRTSTGGTGDIALLLGVPEGLEVSGFRVNVVVDDPESSPATIASKSLVTVTAAVTAIAALYGEL